MTGKVQPLVAGDFASGFPFGALELLRNRHPVFLGELPDGTPSWNLVRYNDILQALRDWRTFAAPEHGAFPEQGPRETNSTVPQGDLVAWTIKAMMVLNPPDHGPHRQRLAPSMRKQYVDRFRFVLRQTAVSVTSSALQKGNLDAVEDFSAIFAVRVIAAYLGIPESNSDYLRRLSAAFMGDNLPPPRVGGYQNLSLGSGALRAVVGSPACAAMELVHESWCQKPWLDTEFVSSADRWEIEDLGLQAVTAGIAGIRNCVTTAVDLMATSWETVDRDRDSWLESLPVVAEEIIRLACPLLRARRVLTRDVRIHGQHMRAGDTVLLWIVGANTDPAVFAEPSEFLPFRSPNPHLSFGAGPHHCLGFLLARMEVEECVRAILKLWRKLSLTGRPERFGSNVVNEYVSLPVSVE